MGALGMGGVATAGTGEGDPLFILTAFCKSWLDNVPLGPRSPDCIKLANRLLAAAAGGAGADDGTGGTGSGCDGGGCERAAPLGPGKG